MSTTTPDRGAEIIAQHHARQLTLPLADGPEDQRTRMMRVLARSGAKLDTTARSVWFDFDRVTAEHAARTAVHCPGVDQSHFGTGPSPPPRRGDTTEVLRDSTFTGP